MATAAGIAGCLAGAGLPGLPVEAVGGPRVAFRLCLRRSGAGCGVGTKAPQRHRDCRRTCRSVGRHPARARYRSHRPDPDPVAAQASARGQPGRTPGAAVSGQTRLAVDARALRRRGWWGPRQAQAQSRADRRRIVTDAFLADPGRVDGRGILLVDDVSTTMATLAEAARTLLAAGATAVDAWTAARAD